MSRTIWVVVLGGFAFLFVLGVFVLKTKSQAPTTSSQVTVEQGEFLRQALSEELSDQDQDGDGLRDWEEGLWGTDLQNPDTDGDGTSDGHEVDENRNPTLAGPDDSLSATNQSTATNSSANDQDLNTTDRFSQEFFAKYLNLRQSGQLENQAVLTYTLNSVIEEAVDETAPTTYTRTDIKTTSDTSATRIRAYGNAVGATISQYTVATDDNAEILLSVLEGGDDGRLQELQHNAAVYTSIAQDLSNTEVPSNALSAHLALTNSIASLGRTIEDMALIFEDPLRSTVAIGRYKNIAEELAPAFQEISSYFKQNNVNFSEGEPGFVLVNIL